MTRVRIHAEPGGWWAEVPDLPGCYAAAATLDELAEALDDAVRLWQAPAPLPRGSAGCGGQLGCPPSRR